MISHVDQQERGHLKHCSEFSRLAEEAVVGNAMPKRRRSRLCVVGMILAFLSLTAAAVEDAPFLQPVNDQQPSEQQASQPDLVENLVDYLTALRESERLTREEETICYEGSTDGSELPSVLCGKVNSYLAASPWPTSHRTPYS